MSFKDEIGRLSEEIAELTQLCELAKLPSVKTFLKQEISRLGVRKSNLVKELENTQSLANSSVGVAPNADSEKARGLGLTLVQNYMWDQTNQAIKIYIEVSKDQKIEESQLSLKVGPDSKSVACVFGKFRFTLGRLYKSIDEEKSSVKITKSNRVVITLAKADPGNWASLNVQDSALKDSLAPGDKGLESDPSAGLMKMMKSMYDEGDDDMKRTIAKSWYESRNKQSDLGLDPEL